MNLFTRAKNIIVNPKTEWVVIASESTSFSQLITSYVLPFAIIDAIAAFLGYGFFAFNVLNAGTGISGVSLGLFYAVVAFLRLIISIAITAFIVDALAPSFHSEKNIHKTAQLVVYSSTPALIGAILLIFPPISWIGSLFGLYGIYLWYLGLGPVKNTPENDKVVFMIVSWLVLILAYVVIGMLLGLFRGLVGLTYWSVY
jgi:hypothetical protein